MSRPLSPLDLVFLWLDRPETPANVGVVMLLDPPPGSSARTAARRLTRDFRAARPTAPFDRIPELHSLGLPRWRPVSSFDMRYHVRQETLRPPGGPAQLRERVAELHRERLDRRHPLFRLHVLDGLQSGQVALYVKMHHAGWDGRSALARLLGTLATQPGAPRVPFFALRQDTSRGEAAEASTWLADGARGLISHTMALRELVAAARTREGAGNRPFAGPPTRFNQPVVAARSFAPFALPLDEMRRVAHAFDGKVNDVVLAVVDAGVERFLASLGERPRRPLVAMCPVSLRSEGDVEAAIKVATLFVPLGPPRASAARRLRQVVENTGAAKQEFHALSQAAALDYALLAFGLWFASHALGVDAVARPVVNLVISNVGGLPGVRYLGDLRLAGAYPVSMVADPVGLNVSTVSLGNDMYFGILACRKAVPDAGEIARHCLAAWRALRAAAGRPRADAVQPLVLRNPPVRRPSRARRMPRSQRS